MPHIDKSVAISNHANAEHELYSEISLSLLKVVTNRDNLNQNNMPVTRQQWLKSRKLYNPDDALVSHDANAGDSSLAESVLKNVVVSNSDVKKLSRNAEKVLGTKDFKQSGYCATSSSPEHAAVQTVVEVLLEPLPEDKGRRSKNLRKTNKTKKVVNKAKEGIETDLDAIEIIKSTDSRICEKPQTEGISLLRTLTELNKNVDLNKTETTTSYGNQKRPNVIKQITKTKPVKKNENKSAFDLVVRQDIHDGYESLYSDNEVLTPKKIKREFSTPPITKLCIKKHVVRPLSFKRAIMSCNKLESSSSSSSLPDLEIEMEMPFYPAVIERLSSSLSSPFEDNLPVPVSTSPTITVATGGKYKDDSPSSCILSSEAKEINVEHSHDAIRSWVATGHSSDSAEVFKSIAEAVLSGYAAINRAYLEAFKGPIHPSLTNLNEILIKHGHDLDNYLNKK